MHSRKRGRRAKGHPVLPFGMGLPDDEGVAIFDDPIEGWWSNRWVPDEQNLTEDQGLCPYAERP